MILAWQDHRGFFQTKYEGGNEPPDCHAEEPEDGMQQTGSKPRGKYNGAIYGGTCKTCPVGQWKIEGDKKTRPLCGPRVRVFIQTKEIALPVMVDLPSTSIPRFTTYMKALTQFGYYFHQVVTIFTLQMEQTAKKIEYPVCQPLILRNAPEVEGQKGKPWVMSTEESLSLAGWRAGIETVIDPANRTAQIAAAAEQSDEEIASAEAGYEESGSAAAAYGVTESDMHDDESKVKATM